MAPMSSKLSVALHCALFAGAAFVAVHAQEVRQQIQIGGPRSDGAPLQMLPPGPQAKTRTGSLPGRAVANDTRGALRPAQGRLSGPELGTTTAPTAAQGPDAFR